MSQSTSISFSIEVEAPIWRVYRQWRRLERFPAFMPSVREARWLARNRLYWREEYAGQEYESTFEIVMNEPGNSLTWRSVSGPQSAGSAVCEAQFDGGTVITLSVQYAPDQQFQAAEAVGARHRRYLKCFKAFVEGELVPKPTDARPVGLRNAAKPRGADLPRPAP